MVDWKLYIDSPQKRALKLCYGSLTEGNGFGSGFGYGFDDGEGWGNGWTFYNGGLIVGVEDGDGGSSTEW